MGRGHALLFMAFLALGCRGARGDDEADGDGDSDADADGDGDIEPDRPGQEQLGNPCEGACGSADDRKCAINSPDCPNDLCLVDPGHPQVTYCTVDCTDVDCPAGYSCEDIESFGDRSVERGCVAEPAECGDDVVQLGEACDGDSPERGRCIDCAAWESVCGDGHVQDDEVCDGDGAEGYCVDCSRFMPPDVLLTVRSALANAVQSVQGNTTYFYGANYQGDLDTELPRPADAEGCGGLEVLSTDELRTVLRWRICDYEDVVTWTFALPRDLVDLSFWDGVPPDEWAVAATLEHPPTGQSLDWTTAEHSYIFELRSWMVEDRGYVRGSLRARMEQDDPIQYFTTAVAELELDFEIHHPVLAD